MCDDIQVAPVPHHPGGFQLEFVIISRVINQVTCYKFEWSHWSKVYLNKNPLQDLLSGLNAAVSTNERTVFIHVMWFINWLILTNSNWKPPRSPTFLIHKPPSNPGDLSSNRSFICISDSFSFQLIASISVFSATIFRKIRKEKGFPITSSFCAKIWLKIKKKKRK